MKKQIIGIFVCMLLVAAVLPAASSVDKENSNQLHNEIIVDDGCGCNTYKEINDKDREDAFPNYPVMSNPSVQLDPDDASPKPHIMDTPDEFSWMNYDGHDWTTSVKKQLCGDCWDFAAIGILESVINIREECAELNPDLSEQYVLSCLPGAGSCYGGNPYLALKYMMENSSQGNYHNGAIPESCFLYQGDDDIPCSDKCPNWEELLIPILDCGAWTSDGSAEDREAIKTQIIQTGPVVAGIKATDFLKIWGSIYHDSEDYFPYLRRVFGINHVVIIVGWKDDSSIRKGGYWICKNSWGTDWGYGGLFNIEYNALNIDNSMMTWVDYNPESFNWAPVADAGGLYYGDIGEEITFDASSSFDSEGDISIYYWDFGDGTNDTGVTATHTYSQQEIYPVTLTVTDSGDNIANDATWAGIEESIDPPSAPTITGLTSGAEGTEYEYTFQTTDPNGDDVYYYIEWGGYFDIGEWIGPYASGEQIILTHTWNNKGTYTIREKSIDVYDQEIDLGTLKVNMPKNKAFIFNFYLLEWLFERFPNAFPILRHILGR